ncbi:TatD family deoxyribonuclease [Salibacterium salarium]|uniref:TatD family deoxyribonuclease n=1 Tax=Salibacterium salarium TaxID=284579 RepID=A0A428N6N5_9BACI|nr:TatD family hydrolase [Salibacterium salarium]RSL34026.1 TatD family deoxyribonuclease [Salibacterium salarium]
MIDAHIHLEKYDNLAERIEKWQAAGIEKVVAVSNDLASSYRTLELKTQYPDFILAGCGFHPEMPLPTHADFQEWLRLVKSERERIACIGEIGLPHYEIENLPASLQTYQEFLVDCVKTAEEHHLPVALHAVHDKAKIVYEILKKETPSLSAHFHWLKAPADVTRNITASGYFVSVTPEVCYRERDQQLAAMIPENQLLLETDGPWPFQGPFTGHETTPLFIETIINYLAQKNNTSPHFLRQKTKDNAWNMYGYLK